MARGTGGLPSPSPRLLPASIKQPLVFWPQTQQAGRGRLHIFALTNSQLRFLWVGLSGQKRVMGTGFRETPSQHFRTCSFCPASLTESFKCFSPSVWIWKGTDFNAGQRIRRENYSKAQRLDQSISNCLDCWTVGPALPSDGAFFFMSVTHVINCARVHARLMTWLIPVEWKWPFKVALISHKMPRLSKMSISVYTQTEEPCFDSTNMKKADISFPFRKLIQIPDVRHESSTLHLSAFLKIKTVEKSKQLIRAAVWRLDLTGWWRRGQLHLVITYLFSLISSAFISYVWKQRNVKGWYGKKKPLGHSCPEKSYILTKYLTKSCL